MPKVIYRKDYRPLSYHIHHIDMTLELDEHATKVRSQLHVKRTEHGKVSDPLFLDGQNLKLLNVQVNGTSLSKKDYTLTEKGLSLTKTLPDEFTVNIENTIDPTANKSCMGLYRSKEVYTTQCESENFRRITFFQDRPDNLATYTTTVIADKSKNPLMLSNGNCIEEKILPDNRHLKTFEDPIPKPSYLFALVAGQLRTVKDYYITQEQAPRKIELSIHTSANKISKTEHAMHALQKAFEWDERVYKLPYDLDVYHIVGVPDFNAGAMENKGLNIFNSGCLLVNPQTSSDNEFEFIYSVVGHEFFHNYAGNRVTVKNWFELALKEGLASQKEREFLADMIGYTLPRIKDVKALKTRQFPEDAGPNAHSVRTESYVDIRNFYTRTTYSKGAELLSTLSGLLGQDTWRECVREYFIQMDGQAATIDDFLRILSETSGKDLRQFSRWYSQAGTPAIQFEDHYDPKKKTYTLTVSQSCPPTHEQPVKLPFHIPIKMGLLDKSGRAIPLRLKGEKRSRGTERMLELTDYQQSFTFVGVQSKPIPSLLRDFSAPVKVDKHVLDNQQKCFLMAHDSNEFNCWDAAQQLHEHVLLEVVSDLSQGKKPHLDKHYLKANRDILLDKDMNPALRAEIVSLPNFSAMLEKMETFDPDLLFKAYRFVTSKLNRDQESVLKSLYSEMKQGGQDSYSPENASKRSLKNLALGRLVSLHKENKHSDYLKLAKKQYYTSLNMTDRMAALGAIVNQGNKETHGLSSKLMNEFYEQYKEDEEVIDNWLRLQACYTGDDALKHMQRMLEHPAFDMHVPNCIYALIRTFIQANPRHFHKKDGKGYEFIADIILQLDEFNEDMASTIAQCLVLTSKLDADRMQKLLHQCERIASKPQLSDSVSEVMHKAIDDFRSKMAADSLAESATQKSNQVLSQFRSEPQNEEESAVRRSQRLKQKAALQ